MQIDLKLIATAPEVEAYLLPVSAFPVPDAELSQVVGFVQSLTSILRTEWGLSSEVFLQFNQLYLADGAVRLTENAKEWKPGLGLGVWPDGPPPSTWTKEEFEQLEPGDKLRPLCHKLFQVRAAEPARSAARDAMLDVGAVIEVFSAPANKLLDQTKQLLLPRIKERSFTTYPFYVPLLQAKSLGHNKPSEILDWFCGATVYLRGSDEDGGILLAATRPLGDVLKRVNAHVVDETRNR